MKKKAFLTAVMLTAVSSAALLLIYRVHGRTPYSMAWDMAAHSYYGAEIGQDILLFRPLSFLRHINDSSIALWPFLHPLLLGCSFSFFGFSMGTATALSLAFSLMTIAAVSRVCWIATGRQSVVPGLLAVFLLLSSPLYLAFSAYVMLEIFGAFFTFLTIGLVAGSREPESRPFIAAPAVAFLCLFLTKINYGLYLFVPYLIWEALNLATEKRRDYGDLFMRLLDVRNPRSVINILIFLTTTAIIVMMLSGGFYIPFARGHSNLSGTRDLVYLLLALISIKAVVFWIRNRHELHEKLLPGHLRLVRIVVVPLLLWFLIHPGRIGELIRMSSDRSTGLPFLGLHNLVYYPGSIVGNYTCCTGIGVAVIVLVSICAVMWRGNPPVIRLLLLYTAFGYAGLTLQLRHFAEPRFFFVQAVAAMVISGYTIWKAGVLLAQMARWPRIVYCSAIVLAVILTALFPVKGIYLMGLENIISSTVPTGGQRIDDMVRSTVARVDPEARKIAIVGGCNEISPYLVKWHLIRENPRRTVREVNPPVKSAGTSEDRERLSDWLSSREVDAVIAIAVSGASPFARSADFELRHADKQTVVEAMEEQTLYQKVSEDRWKSRAAEIRLYKPAPQEPE